MFIVLASSQGDSDVDLKDEGQLFVTLTSLLGDSDVYELLRTILMNLYLEGTLNQP